MNRLEYIAKRKARRRRAELRARLAAQAPEVAPSATNAVQPETMTAAQLKACNQEVQDILREVRRGNTHGPAGHGSFADDPTAHSSYSGGGADAWLRNF